MEESKNMFLNMPASVDELEGLTPPEESANEESEVTSKRKKSSQPTELSDYVKSCINAVEKPQKFEPPADPEACVRQAVEKLGKEMKDTLNRINEAVQKKTEKKDEMSKAFRGYASDALDEQLKARSKALDESVISYLITLCQKDVSFARLVIHPVKAYDKCRKLIWDRVKAVMIPGDMCCCIDNNVVYEWAADYYKEDAEKEGEEEYKKNCEKAKEKAIAEEKRKKKEERQKKEEERKKKKEKKEKQEKMQMSFHLVDPETETSHSEKEEDLTDHTTNDTADEPDAGNSSVSPEEPKEEDGEVEIEESLDDEASDDEASDDEISDDGSSDDEDMTEDNHLEGFEDYDHSDDNNEPAKAKSSTVTVDAGDEDEQMSILNWLNGN